MAAVGRIGRALRRVGRAGRARPAKATASAPAKKSSPKKTAPAHTAPATKAAPPAQPLAAKAAAAKSAPPTNTIPAKKVPSVTKAAPKAPSGNGVAVPAGSEWTRAELAAVRKQLVDELAEMRSAYDMSMRDLDNLQRSSTDGAGDDQADAGSKTFEREQEQSIAANRLDLMTQIEHAIERIEAGTYGFCERCGKPIPKARLQAFPAATLDVGCKQREERR
jgi:RNA polymerase-binding protein DksA